MQRTKWFALAVILLGSWSIATAQQIGKYVPIQAGSDVDHALNEINATADPAQKLALIEKFAEGPGKEGNYPLVANGLFVDYYLSQKNYDKAFEYGDKLFAFHRQQLALPYARSVPPPIPVSLSLPASPPEHFPPPARPRGPLPGGPSFYSQSRRSLR